MYWLLTKLLLDDYGINPDQHFDANCNKTKLAKRKQHPVMAPTPQASPVVAVTLQASPVVAPTLQASSRRALDLTQLSRPAVTPAGSITSQAGPVKEISTMDYNKNKADTKEGKFVKVSGRRKCIDNVQKMGNRETKDQRSEMNTNCEAFIFFKLHKVADHEHDDDCDEFKYLLWKFTSTTTTTTQYILHPPSNFTV